MIYLYLFGTCFHFIYVFMIIGNYRRTSRLIPCCTNSRATCTLWIPILSSVIAGLVVGISNHSLWGGIGTGIAVLIVFGISSAIVGGN